MRNIFVSLNQYLERRRGLFLVIFVLLLGLAAWKTSGIRLEENLDAIIPEDRRISDISSAFNRSEISDQIVFILSLADSGRTEPAMLMDKADRLVSILEKDSLVDEITYRVGGDAMMDIYHFIHAHLPLFLDEEDYEKIEGMLHPDSIGMIIEKDFKSVISPAGMATARFIRVDPLNLTPMVLQKLEQFRLDDNFITYQNCVFTKDLRHLLFFMDPRYPGSNTRKNAILVENIENAIASVDEELQEAEVHYYGGAAVAVANSLRVKKDIYLTLSIALAAFLLIFLVFFRRLHVIVLMFLPVIIGAVFALFVLTRLYGNISAIALGIGVIFLGITIDYSLHLFTHIRHGESLQESLRRISLPILMSALTTASAFLCLTVIRSEAMNQIGIFAAIAVGTSALSVLIITPLLLKGGRKGKMTFPGRSGRTLLEKVVAWDFHRSRILILVVLLLSIVFVFTSRSIRFNGDISTLNYQTRELNESEALLESISSVTESAVYLITRGESLDQALEKLEARHGVLDEAMENGEISEISMVTELMLSRKGQAERIVAWNAFWQRMDRKKVIERISEAGLENHFKEDAFSGFYDLLGKEFTPIPLEDYAPLKDLLLESFIQEEADVSAVISIVKVKQDQKEALFERVSRVEEFIIFDNQFFINQFFEILKEDFNKLVRISMLVVFLILLIFFGRIEIALATFIPILISWTWTLGLMGLFGLEINVFNIIISTFVFGLGIDYCIFLMNGIIANYREGTQSLTPYKLSILFSALTTIAAVGVLIFARHPALRSIALVSIFGISTVVLVAYTLLPLFFNWLVRARGKARLEPVSMYTFLVSLLFFSFFVVSALIVTLLLPLYIILPLGKHRKKRGMSRIIQLFSAFIVRIGFIMKKRYLFTVKQEPDEPVMFIANHQSQLDLLLMLQLHPRMVVLVNKWVWNNVFYGPIIRFADFYPVYKGLEYDLDKLREKVAEGYSVLAFPEGRRSPDGSIKRFHQGAFGIASMLNLKIMPLVIHGAYEALPKTELVLKPGSITIEALPLMEAQAQEYGDMVSYHKQAKEVTALYRKEFDRLKEEVATPDFHASKLISRYIYKGPVLEWYLRVKLQKEGRYHFFNDLIPRNASVADLGCGFGFLSLMLGLVAPGRKIRGMDYDAHKIRVARQAAHGIPSVEFMETDLLKDPIPEAEIYILNDVLHYLPEASQLSLLKKCLEKIPGHGMVIVRDADASERKGTRWTRFTEWQSTRLFQFNKRNSKLEYLPAADLISLAENMGFLVKSHRLEKRSSNTIHVIKRKGSDGGK